MTDPKPRVLFLTTPKPDYLQDSVLVGLKNLLGKGVADVPVKECLYEDFDPDQPLYGRGFTLYRTLARGCRSDLGSNPRADNRPIGEYDLIIFGRLRRQKNLLFKLLLGRLLLKRKPALVFLDGEDHQRLFWPAMPFGHYFKREKSTWAGWVRAISFGIPSSKLLLGDRPKTKDFPRHVQCEEAYKLERVRANSENSYAFDHEIDYYGDIAESRFGVTMKKGGWDCMRHYEIAAQGTVPVFYRLRDKPEQCAPHGLVDMENCIAFDTAEELEEKIQTIDGAPGQYETIRERTIAWARDHTCEAVASRVLARVTGCDLTSAAQKSKASSSP
jgi:hypothetical protein